MGVPDHPKTALGESPFSLAYRTEAVLPPEMVFSTLRTKNFEEGTLEEGLRANFDLLEERRAAAHLRILVYKRAMAQLYNRRVHRHQIKAGDVVLQKAKASDPTRARGKLTLN